MGGYGAVRSKSFYSVVMLVVGPKYYFSAVLAKRDGWRSAASQPSSSLQRLSRQPRQAEKACERIKKAPNSQFK